jgi:hypothetical protein
MSLLKKIFKIKTVYPNEMARYGDEPRAGRPRFESRQREISCFYSTVKPTKRCRGLFLQR